MFIAPALPIYCELRAPFVVAIVKAIENVLQEGPKTPDLGGSAKTEDLGKAVAGLLQ